MFIHMHGLENEIHLVRKQYPIFSKKKKHILTVFPENVANIVEGQKVKLDNIFHCPSSHFPKISLSGVHIPDNKYIDEKKKLNEDLNLFHVEDN